MLQIGRVAVEDVEEAHRRRAFAGRVAVKGDGWAAPFEPAPIVVSTQGKRSLRQPKSCCFFAASARAIELLPHLEEAVHRAGRIGVIGIVGVGQLIRAIRQMAGVLARITHARIGNVAGLARAAGQQILVIIVREGGFDALGQREIGGRHAGLGGDADGLAEIRPGRAARHRRAAARNRDRSWSGRSDRSWCRSPGTAGALP